MTCVVLLLVINSLSGTDAFSSYSTGTAASQRRTKVSFSPLQVTSINPQGQGNDNQNEDVASAAQKIVAKAAKASTSKQLSTTPKISAATIDEDLASVVDFDWQSIAEQVFEHDRRPIILFDGVCNLCNGGVNFAMDHDSQAKFRFASLQSKVAQSLLLREGKHPTQTQNIVLVTPEQAYFKSQAVAKICAQLDMPLLQLFGNVGQAMPKALREPIYKFISRHRFVLGENDSCRLDLDGEYTSRFVSDPTVVTATKTTVKSSQNDKASSS
jgi:predicted DCC family thiol-disulfide oxidoreductase YuxK